MASVPLFALVLLEVELTLLFCFTLLLAGMFTFRLCSFKLQLQRLL